MIEELLNTAKQAVERELASGDCSVATMDAMSEARRFIDRMEVLSEQGRARRRLTELQTRLLRHRRPRLVEALKRGAPSEWMATRFTKHEQYNESRRLDPQKHTRDLELRRATYKRKFKSLNRNPEQRETAR